MNATGWYLISLPLQPENTAPDAVLASIDGKYNSIWAYDPATGWAIYVPGGVSDLTELVAGKGYWLKMDQAGTLTITGTTPGETAINLIGGVWNLAGYSSMTQQEAANCMSAVVAFINSVWEYHPATGWKIYVPGGVSDLIYMKPGYGYWIKADLDCVWDVND